MVLGANSALPQQGRFPSSFVLSYKHIPILLDCGEGSQIKMAQHKVKGAKIDHIFITHMHGDHVFGLPGLLNSFNLGGRQRPLTIIGPKGIQSFIDAISSATGSSFRYELRFIELEGASKIDLGVIQDLEVVAFPLKHRITTFGYKFTEVLRVKNIIRDKIAEHNLSHEEILLAKNGADIVRPDGSLVRNQELTHPLPQPRSFAYVTDTIYDEEVIPYISGCDMIYHEATYLENLKKQARERMHATAIEAATIATKAKVKKLIIGHYSSRYRDLEPLLVEAKSAFENTELALEGRIYSID